MTSEPLRQSRGPFYARQIRDGDPYELDNGHPIECLPSGGRHAKANVSGGLTLETDPEVDSAGFEAGYSADEQTLRAPDIAVGNVPDRPGWVPGAPPLAVEYADTGQDEAGLQAKIQTLLEAGSRYVWVVRLSGPRLVEVYEPGKGRRRYHPGEELKAPGVLKNPVPVEALYDADAAHRVALRNLLQRQGYEDLDAVREEGREEGHEEGREEGLAPILRLARRLFPGLDAADEARIRGLAGGRLAALGDVLLDLEGLDGLRAWLDGDEGAASPSGRGMG